MQINGRDAPEAGELWRHAHGDIYSILAIGVHTETSEYFVVYRLQKANPKVQAWCRPLHMFMSKMTTLEEDVESLQRWRFEKVNTRSLPSKEANRVSEGVA